DIAQTYYWLFVILRQIPFILVAFLLLRLVTSLSLKDVVHLSLYPLGAGVFTGTVLAFVASATARLLVTVGYIPEIEVDLTQGVGQEQLFAVYKHALYDCLKTQSTAYSFLAAGTQNAYDYLKPPID